MVFCVLVNWPGYGIPSLLQFLLLASGPRNNKKNVQCVMSYTMSSTAGGNWESLDKKSLTVSMAEPAREEDLLHEYSAKYPLFL
jgi:hypothetical protein